MREPNDIVEEILKLKRFLDEGDSSAKEELVLNLTLLKYQIGPRFDELPWFADLLAQLTKKERKEK